VIVYNTIMRSLKLVVGSMFVLASCFDPSASGDSSDTDTTTGDPDSGSTEPSPTSGMSTSGMTMSGMTESPTSTSPTTTMSPTTTDSATDGETTTGDPACTADEVCVPDLPGTWEGPFVVDPSAEQCPAAYPEAGDTLHDGFDEGEYQCDCNCNVGSVACQLVLENAGSVFVPSGSCDSPPFEDECLGARVNATCLDNAIDEPAEPSFDVTARPCGGAVPGAACSAGNCFPDPGSGDLCIARSGEADCPAAFPERTLYHRSFSDNRDCSPCACSESGQSCEVDVEICSLGFDQTTLVSGGACYQLNSSDGDGVTLFSTAITDQGACAPNPGAGELSGQAVPTEPVTVCCLG
jgi:hypothetical protein